MFNKKLMNIWNKSIYHVYTSIAVLLILFLGSFFSIDEPLDEVLFMMLYFMFSIPSALIGLFTSKDVSTRAGLGYGLAYFTALLVLTISGYCYFKIVAVLCVLSLGIISTWTGSLVGERFQKKYKLGLKTAFVIIYIFYLVLLLVVFHPMDSDLWGRTSIVCIYS